MGKGNSDEEGEGDAGVKVTIVDKSVGQGATDACDDWYGGIGVQTDYGGIITYVGKGYPADRAGIKIGDHMREHFVGVRGEPGTQVDVTFTRDGVEFTKTFTREKICETH